jgi:hypothetical protein
MTFEVLLAVAAWLLMNLLTPNSLMLPTRSEGLYRYYTCSCVGRIEKALSSLPRTLGSWDRIPLKAWMSMCIYSVFVLSCISSDLATGWSPVQGVLSTPLGSRNWSETKHFTDALCSKMGARGRRVREIDKMYVITLRMGATAGFACRIN